jgi:23S rRNA (uracil1939-C5)-methyltransferase
MKMADSTRCMAGDDHLVMEAAGRAFRVSAGSFFQVNTPQAENMLRYLLENLPLDPHERCWKSMPGWGCSAPSSPRAWPPGGGRRPQLRGGGLCRQPGRVRQRRAVQRRGRRYLPALELRPDLVLVDPPRAGLALPVLDALVRMAPARLAYISCDPATLARDAKRLLAAGYRSTASSPSICSPRPTISRASGGSRNAVRGISRTTFCFNGQKLAQKMQRYSWINLDFRV